MPESRIRTRYVRTPIVEEVQVVDQTELLSTAPASVKRAAALKDPQARIIALGRERDLLRQIAFAMTRATGVALQEIIDNEPGGISQPRLAERIGLGTYQRVQQLLRRAAPLSVELLAQAPPTVRKAAAIKNPERRIAALNTERDRLRTIATACSREMGKSLSDLMESSPDMSAAKVGKLVGIDNRQRVLQLVAMSLDQSVSDE